MSEEVMVVRRADIETLLARHPFDLIREGIDGILERFESQHFFVARPVAEVSPEYKQIIPYVVIRQAGAYFLLERTTKQTEARLHHKLSLGIGGHINPDTPTIRGGLQKELDEEVSVAAPYALTFIGLINDDSTDVGRVHLGAVYVLDIERRDVTVLETEKMSGSWVEVDDLAASREGMETWSQLVYDRYILA